MEDWASFAMHMSAKRLGNIESDDLEIPTQ